MPAHDDDDDDDDGMRIVDCVRCTIACPAASLLARLPLREIREIIQPTEKVLPLKCDGKRHKELERNQSVVVLIVVVVAFAAQVVQIS